MVDAGAFPNGVMGMSATEADQMFANEEAAMYYEGAWKVGNFESAGGAEFLEKLDRLDWPAMTDCPDGVKWMEIPIPEWVVVSSV